MVKGKELSFYFIIGLIEGFLVNYFHIYYYILKFLRKTKITVRMSVKLTRNCTVNYLPKNTSNALKSIYKYIHTSYKLKFPI